jgi:hypothetical protein
MKMNQESAEIKDLTQTHIRTMDDSVAGVEKRPYRAPAIAEFTPCAWAGSGSRRLP